jgi:hypothetical protein
VEPPEQLTVTGTAEGAAVHDDEAEELEVDDVVVIELDDELVESVELDELLEMVELEVTKLELDERQGGAGINATCNASSVATS